MTFELRWTGVFDDLLGFGWFGLWGCCLLLGLSSEMAISCCFVILLQSCVMLTSSSPCTETFDAFRRPRFSHVADASYMCSDRSPLMKKKGMQRSCRLLCPCCHNLIFHGNALACSFAVCVCSSTLGSERCTSPDFWLFFGVSFCVCRLTTKATVPTAI